MFLLFLRIVFSKLCTLSGLQPQGHRHSLKFVGLCPCIYYHRAQIFICMLPGNLKMQGILVLLHLLKLIFKLLLSPSKYIKALLFFPFPEMMPFAHISRTKVDDTKYNKLPHSDISSLILDSLIIWRLPMWNLNHHIH